MDMMFIDYLARFGHMLFGVTWIGLLYYFNFVQTEYFKEAEPAARVDAFSKLALAPCGGSAGVPWVPS